MNRSEETANTSDNTDDLRVSVYNSLDASQRNQYFTQKRSFLNNLRKSNMFCDVTLVCENDVEIKAHKVVLSVASQFFFTKFAKYNEDRVLLKDFDSSTLESLVQYAYTSEITINEDNIEDILQAADYFCMEILRNLCGNFLSTTITLSNCLRIRSIADRLSIESLLNDCDSFIKEHFTEVIKDKLFLDLPVDGLLKIIRDDYLNVASETTVYTAVMKWIKYDLEKRQKYLFRLMRHVRLAFLGRDRLSRISFLEPLFANICDLTCMREIQRLFFDAFEEGNLLAAASLAISDVCVPVPRIFYSPIPKMFVIGGESDAGIQNVVDCFDIRQTVWYSVSHLNRPVVAAQAVSTGNKIYVTDYDEAQIYDIKADKWTKNSRMPLRTNRRHHTSVLLNDKIYVIGGKSLEMVTLASVEYYCLREDIWVNVPDMMERREFASAAVLNGKIYVISGGLNSVEFYDPATSTWKRCKARQFRSGAAVSVDNLLYVVGGRDEDNVGDKFEVYDPITDEWELLPNLPVPRMHHGVCYDNGYLFVVGGKCDGAYVKSIDVFCFVTRKWYKMGAQLNVARCHAGVVMAHESRN